MADILAISAAVVQFLDIAVRVSLELGKLYSDLRDVPGQLHRLKLDIDQQIAIAKYILSSHATFQSDPPGPVTATSPIDQTLADYVLAMEELTGLLQSIRSEDDAGSIRRSWNAIRAVHKRNKILSLCDRLEHQKSTILLWLASTNTELSVQIKTLIEGLHVKVDKMFHLTQNIEENSMKADQQLRQIPDLATLSNETRLAVSELTHSIDSAHQRLLTTATSTNTQISILQNQWQELAPTFHEFRDIMQNNPHLLQSIYQFGTARRGLSPRNGYSSSLGANPSGDVISHDTSRGAATSKNHSCTCRDISNATNIEPLSFLHFKKVFRRHHYRQCPKSKISETSLEFFMKIIPPTWLLSHTIHLGFSLQFSKLQTSWKISPLVVGTSRLVDSRTAPTFCAIQKTWQFCWSETGIQPAHVSALERTLRDIFECQQGSAFDEDANGSTLLYGVLDLYIYSSHSNTPPMIEFFSLIRFLIDGGANPNIHRRGQYKNGVVVEQAGTVLDIFASMLLDLDLSWSRGWSMDKSVYESLIDGGAIFSRPLATCGSRHPVFYFGHFKQEVVELQTFEEQIDGISYLPVASCHHTESVCVVCDLNDLMVSILRRNEPDFIRALGKDDIQAVSRANGLRAIHLAIYWPWALKQIIQADADVNCEDSHQRRPIHLAVTCRQAQSVEILLQADCSVSTPNYSNSLLQEALIQGREFDYVTDLIIDALIDRHTRLRDLALSVLPNDSGPSVDIEKETLSEVRAPEIYDSLVRAKHNIPPALQVDRGEEGVYDTAEMHGRIRLTVTLADKLWRGGFHRFDEFAPLNGLTPLLQSWYIADFDMVSWFIEKGASPFTTHRDGLLSGLHLYAARIAYPGGHFHHDPKEVPISPQHWHQLTSRGDMWHDSCHCSCSIGGCTPISILIKKSWRFLLRERNNNYAGMMELLSICRKTMIYEPERDPRHVQQLLEAIVFERMNLRHTCCYIGQLGQIYFRPEWDAENKEFCEGNIEVDFRQILADYAVKMLECQCPAAEKPICVVFRDTCGTTV